MKTVFEITAKVVKEKEKNEVKRSTFQLVISYLVELVSEIIRFSFEQWIIIGFLMR